MKEFELTVSVVLYNTDKREIEHVIKLINSSGLSTLMLFIDNSSKNDLEEFFRALPNVKYIFNNANLGYGSGHNIAINIASKLSAFHLIMNTDLDFEPGNLVKAINHMKANPEVSMISPQVIYPDGKLQYFCRKLPTPFDLFARRFLPKFLKSMFKERLNGYILADRDYTKRMVIPNLPGSFMFTRMSNLTDVGGFDRLFMYLEDIDLTRRLHEKGKTLYFPDIVIKHNTNRGSYRFSKLFIYHIKSAIYYFNKWGWFNDKERKEINDNIHYEQEQLVKFN